MLIVKGEHQKSILANILMSKTNSICFQYYDMPVVWDGICVDSTKYSLNDFIECIAEEVESVNTDRKHCDYLIIYTNEREEDLKELINWLNEYRWKFFCKDIVVNDILVMCKE